jgi:hypothetical protein
MVATYTDMLRRHLRDTLDASGVQYLGYILAGAERMEMLLTGLRAYMQAATFTARPRNFRTLPRSATFA